MSVAAAVAAAAVGVLVVEHPTPYINHPYYSSIRQETEAALRKK